MRKAVASLLLLVVLLTTLAGCAKPASGPSKVSIGMTISYPPFEYMEGDKAVGFDVDLWNEIGKRMGREVEFQNIPWEGLIPGLLSKKFDVICSCMGITAERQKQVDFSIPYFKSLFGVVVQAQSSIQTMADLKGKTLGIQTGTMAETWVKENQASIAPKELVPYEEAPDMILDLQAGRIDAVVNDVPYLNYTLKDKPDLRLLSVRFGSPILVGMAFRKEDASLRQEVDKTLRQIIDDGTWAKIYERWFGAAPAPEEVP
ncbi:MAG: ABC transporter substrate-binding protein [Anaerolineae bacterium]